jgi:hypothetical protein
MHRDERLFGSILVLVLAAAFVVAGSFPGRASVAPRAVSAIVIALVLATIAPRARFTNRAEPALQSTPSANSVIGWIPVFLLLIWALGLVVGAPVAILTYLLTASRERPARAIMMAGATYVLLNVVMVHGLDVEFPTGVLVAWARGGKF